MIVRLSRKEGTKTHRTQAPAAAQDGIRICCEQSKVETNVLALVDMSTTAFFPLIGTSRCAGWRRNFAAGELKMGINALEQLTEKLSHQGAHCKGVHGSLEAGGRMLLQRREEKGGEEWRARRRQHRMPIE